MNFLKYISQIFTTMLLALSFGSVQAQDIKVVYHVNSGIDTAAGILGNVRNYLNADPSAKIVVVTHGAGIDFLLDGAKDNKGREFSGMVSDLTAKGVQFRVCNNTLTMARGTKAAYKVSHRSVFDADDARGVVEAAHEEFGAFMSTARALAQIKMDSERAEDLTAKLLTKTNEEIARASAGFGRIMSLFNGAGLGANYETSHDTAWGWLNAVTEYADHHVRARTEENRKASALWGTGEALKTKALELALTQ
jgi:intracellular sulfur oxidation DsrE/DsrF family protein